MRCHFNTIVTCVHACVCIHVCPCACVCVIYGCHPSDDQSSCYCSRRSVNLSQGSPTDLSSILEDNPQAMKCIHKQFTVKSVGSEWPPGVKESVRNTGYSTDPCLVGSIS